MHCVPFPVRRSTSALFYATNIVLSPVIYGVGLVGNLLLLLMLQRRFLRKESAVYVYLTGIAVVDVLSLLVRIPRSLRDMEILPINSSYSKPMAYAAWMCYGADYVFRNSSSWCLAFACIARYISARWPYSPRRFTRISSSRIAVFTLFMFSAMVNFARFFEISAIEVQGHCFPGASLWSEARTSFSRRVGFGVVYPWITACLCYIVPFILIVIFISLLSHATGGAHLRPSRVCHEALRKPRNEDQREIQLTVSVFVITMTYFALETPTIIKHVMLAAMGPTLEQNDFFYEFTLIADCLSLISCTLNFFHLSIFSHDFRKTFTRTFCFLCTRCMGDEYFEGVSCSPCCSGKEEEPVYKDKSLEVEEEEEENWLNANGHHKQPIELDVSDGEVANATRGMNDGWV